MTTTINGKLYRFGFWITQVDCSGVERSPIEAPKGCTQYYLGANGVVKSFNFEGVQYLTNHNYRDGLKMGPRLREFAPAPMKRDPAT